MAISASDCLDIGHPQAEIAFPLWVDLSRRKFGVGIHSVVNMAVAHQTNPIAKLIHRFFGNIFRLSVDIFEKHFYGFVCNKR